jgi:UDP-N-acetylmuramoyl-L-alanyl-D-glutamate--2,6-diaminopimelate ligase
VDYAHTDDALKNVLESLRAIAHNGRIITVFGCGGDRDKGKRPKMGRVAASLSDLCIVTSDNPRREDPQEIIRQIIQGLRSKNVIVEPDRRRAIERALSLAGKGDLVLLAGKGHETYQIIADRRLPFDDRALVDAIIRRGRRHV